MPAPLVHLRDLGQAPFHVGPVGLQRCMSRSCTAGATGRSTSGAATGTRATCGSSSGHGEPGAPDMKPVELVERGSAQQQDPRHDPRSLRRVGDDADRVRACQPAGARRRTRPKYCDVIVRLWQDYTGGRRFSMAAGLLMILRRSDKECGLNRTVPQGDWAIEAESGRESRPSRPVPGSLGLSAELRSLKTSNAACARRRLASSVELRGGSYFRRSVIS